MATALEPFKSCWKPEECKRSLIHLIEARKVVKLPKAIRRIEEAICTVATALAMRYLIVAYSERKTALQ